MAEYKDIEQRTETQQTPVVANQQYTDKKALLDELEKISFGKHGQLERAVAERVFLAIDRMPAADVVPREEVEYLKKENKYLRDRLAEEMEHAKDLAITDTVRKFAEKVTEGEMMSIIDALALIKEQQAEIEKYKKLADLNEQDNKDTCELLFKEEEKCKDLQAHNENLKRENKYLRERLAEEMEHSKDMKVTADIVRCKDCIFCKYNSSALTYRCDRRGYYPQEVTETAFCSYGRRTDDEV